MLPLWIADMDFEVAKEISKKWKIELPITYMAMATAQMNTITPLSVG